MLRIFSRTVAQDGNIPIGVMTEQISNPAANITPLGDVFFFFFFALGHFLIGTPRGLNQNCIRYEKQKWREEKTHKDERLGNVSLFSWLLCGGNIYIYRHRM